MSTQKQGGQPSPKYIQDELDLGLPPKAGEPEVVVRQDDPSTWLTKQQLANRLRMSLRTVERRLSGPAPWPHHRDGQQLVRFSPKDIAEIESIIGRSA